MRVCRRKHIALHRGRAPTPVEPQERWSMDFVQDAFADWRPFRVLTVVDQRHDVAQAIDRVLSGSLYKKGVDPQL